MTSRPIQQSADDPPPRRRGDPPDYSHTLTVRYSETDGQGVVFNSHYQAFCDAVLDLWARDRMGKAWQTTVGTDFSMVVQSRFHYSGPATFLDELTIHGWITRWGRTSFEIEYRGEVAREGSGEDGRRGRGRDVIDEIFTGVMTYVCIDENKRPKAIAPEFKENMPKTKGGGGGCAPRAGLPRSKL